LEDAAVLERLDEAWTGDPETTLEVVAIGEELRDRAIRRASAAGRADPERYRVHRTYLPQDAMVVADDAVDGVLAVALLLDLQWPVDVSSRISSGWGDRIHPISGERKFHNGVDLAVPVGTPVQAAQAGDVVVAAEDDRNGRYLVLEHGHGVRTAYCHLDELMVDKGNPFDRGKLIAMSGNSGRSTGPHLHFVVRVNGKTLDPLPLRRTAPQAALLQK
jgi:murein DD-endopeptidase MepM/ murein hydrolase activator NlpD